MITIPTMAPVSAVKPATKFKTATCIPFKPKNKLSASIHTCYTDDKLNQLKTMWNRRHPKDKIKSKSPRDIWKFIKRKMGGVCKSELCWIKKLVQDVGLRNEFINTTFAPEAPDEWKKNPVEWLSDADIHKVMKQYEAEYKHFVFIGPSPIDFDTVIGNVCVWNDLCKFSIKSQLKKNKTMIGMIFNLDTHDKGGSHWVSLFINLNNNFIFFFDSNGVGPPHQVVTLIERIKAEANDIGKNMDIYINKKQHQRQNTECGIYSIFMISELLRERKKPQDFMKNSYFKDEYMIRLRKQFFNIPE